jgi:hypothetical protein
MVLDCMLFWRRKILLKNGIISYFSYKELAELFKDTIETVKFLKEVHKNDIKALHDALTRAADDYKNLREQLTQKEAEIEQLDKRILIALAGTVCRPQEGYVKAGLNRLGHDVEELVKEYKQINDALELAVLDRHCNTCCYYNDCNIEHKKGIEDCIKFLIDQAKVEREGQGHGDLTQNV